MTLELYLHLGYMFVVELIYCLSPCGQRIQLNECKTPAAVHYSAAETMPIRFIGEKIDRLLD